MQTHLVALLLLLLPTCLQVVAAGGRRRASLDPEGHGAFAILPNPPLSAASPRHEAVDAEIRALRQIIALLQRRREALVQKRGFLFPGIPDEVLPALGRLACLPSLAFFLYMSHR